MSPPDNSSGATATLETVLARMDEAIELLAAAPAFSKTTKLARILDTAKRLMAMEGGCAALESRIQALEEAGVFLGSDWASPQILVPSMTTHALQSPDPNTVVIEALSELRMLAVARGDYLHPQLSVEQAHHYLTQVLAINLAMLFTPPSEAERATQGRLAEIPRRVLRHLAERIGYEHVIDQLIDEIWRILRQRPIQVDPVKQMITQIAICRADPNIDLGASGHGAERLVSSLFAPTNACRDDPGIETFEERLAHLDSSALQSEANGFARAMHDTGLASPYHAAFLRYLRGKADHLLADALGLSNTGRDCLLCYRELVLALIDEAVYPQTAQAVYGLSMMLERGILYQTAVAPALWRQIGLPLSDWAADRLYMAFGDTIPPRRRLLEGVLMMLGLPLGVGQGNNPTCQSARALSMWSFNDPDYLLQILTWGARDDEVIVHFEGQPVSSHSALDGRPLPIDLDPVSLILVPHLDHIYNEMGRMCIGREGDPHRWVNPEFHGWWVGRGFRINVDVATGKLVNPEDFLRHFYAYYHPYYNGNQPLIHPQPAGIAVTDSAARFIGWHAIAIQRVALDTSGEMRVYFFNPNNDSGQDWGDSVKVSTADNGEGYGEASLPFEQFASRLYIFHYDPLERGEPGQVTQEELDECIGYIRRSWGAERLPSVEMQASQGPEG
ncbi:hypothetical protein H0Z60_00930 [Ectothiorhodospiraceae bacterium WFHF3C12]|nr:hypothetical protein [Ectothiorhodospiraceae bacterium WFHF3C12]